MARTYGLDEVVGSVMCLPIQLHRALTTVHPCCLRKMSLVILEHCLNEKESQCIKDYGLSANVWVLADDEAEEGVWRNTDTGEILTYFEWASTQPDGGTDQNCIILRLTETKGFSDTPCSNTYWYRGREVARKWDLQRCSRETRPLCRWYIVTTAKPCGTWSSLMTRTSKAAAACRSHNDTAPLPLVPVFSLKVILPWILSEHGLHSSLTSVLNQCSFDSVSNVSELLDILRSGSVARRRHKGHELYTIQPSWCHMYTVVIHLVLTTDNCHTGVTLAVGDNIV
ncbi:hypothetical protein Pmani_008217 [Petrolisthes manimaculis]|uniref:C-type lectin domain-containing protein n=1 Tax=Petrolisthes manimaculis TaxID=1843537 RepID=A0AAE1Q6T5_9EUCA|nr:hypothetical protein Pmani_008217 [Petrolisthes manimaculis]